MRLESGYEPEDWLGQLCRGRQTFDLSDSRGSEDQWNRIIDELKQLKLPLKDTAGWTHDNKLQVLALKPSTLTADTTGTSGGPISNIQHRIAKKIFYQNFTYCR